MVKNTYERICRALPIIIIGAFRLQVFLQRAVPHTVLKHNYDSQDRREPSGVIDPRRAPGKNFYSSWEISKFIFSFIHLHKNAYLSGQIYSFTLKSKKIPYPLTPHPLYSPDDSFIHKSSSSSTV